MRKDIVGITVLFHCTLYLSRLFQRMQSFSFHEEEKKKEWGNWRKLFPRLLIKSGDQGETAVQDSVVFKSDRQSFLREETDRRSDWTREEKTNRIRTTVQGLRYTQNTRDDGRGFEAVVILDVLFLFLVRESCFYCCFLPKKTLSFFL